MQGKDTLLKDGQTVHLFFYFTVFSQRRLSLCREEYILSINKTSIQEEYNA